MLELGMAVAACIAMIRIASAEDRSPWIWGTITIVCIGVGMMLIPLPYLRTLIIFALLFFAMMVSKIVNKN